MNSHFQTTFLNMCQTNNQLNTMNVSGKDEKVYNDSKCQICNTLIPSGHLCDEHIEEYRQKMIDRYLLTMKQQMKQQMNKVKIDNSNSSSSKIM